MGKKDLIHQNKIFGYIALGTLAILSIPLIVMQFDLVKPDPSNSADVGVIWGIEDFLVIGTLLFGAGSIFVLVARATPSKYRALIGVGFLVAVLYIWAEIAVGIFTNIGS